MLCLRESPRAGDRDRAADEVLRQPPRHRGHHDRGRAGRGLRLPRPQRCGQDDDDPHASGPPAPDPRQRPHLRPRQPPRQRRDPRAARQPARGLRLWQARHRAGGDLAAGAVARRLGARQRRGSRRALPGRPRAANGTALARQPTEDRADLGRLPPTRPADPRRAHERARPADAGGVPGAGARGTRTRLRGLPLLARARRGRAGL